MDQTTLINEAAQLINGASAASGAGDEGTAQKHLVELRTLLNNQPELEAGGDTEEEKPCEKCGK